MYYCYILSSPKTNSYYISHATDLKKELLHHDQGRIDATKNQRPWELIWYGAFTSLQASKDFEAYLKTDIGQKFIDKWFHVPKEKTPNRPADSTICPVCGGSGKAPN